MKIENLLLITTVICCWCETNSDVAEKGENKGPVVELCSCWDSVISYNQHSHDININITLRNCEKLYNIVPFELNFLLSGEDNFTNEEHYSINCNPLMTCCFGKKRFWFPKQKCFKAIAMIKPTCPQGFNFDPRCHCRPVQRDWIQCEKPRQETRSLKENIFPKSIHNSTPNKVKDTDRTSISNKEYIFMAVAVVVAVTTVIAVPIMYMRRKKNNQSTERPNNETKPLATTVV